MVYIIAKLSLSICAFLKASIERIVFETLSIGIFSLNMFQVEGLLLSLKSTATETIPDRLVVKQLLEPT